MAPVIPGKAEAHSLDPEPGQLAAISSMDQPPGQSEIEVRMQKVVDHYQNITKEMHEASVLACHHQRLVWREASAARREGRKPRKEIVEAYMKAQGVLDGLSYERSLHKKEEVPFQGPPSVVLGPSTV